MIERFEYLLGARAHCNILGKVHPSDNAIRIEEKFGRTRYVRSFRSRTGMQNIVTANNLRIRIGQQRKRVPELLRLPLVEIRRIDADGDNANSPCLEFRKPLLETPQLGVAEQSPKSAIENQRNRFRWSGRSAEQIAKPDRFSILIQ